MRYDGLRSPISELDPSGPDLDEEGDNDYLNYMLVAGGRLPTKFFSKPSSGGAEAPFDKSSIDLDTEVETIGGLLARSRDIRLLTLEARFQILAGNLIGFSEAVQGLAIVVSTFWDTFLPLPYEGDHMLRQNTVEGLDDPVQVVLPLQYATMVEGTGSPPSVTFRRYQVASGKAKARAEEEVLKLPDLDRSLSVDPDRDRQSARPEAIAAMVASATATHEAIVATLASLQLIRDTFIKNAGHESAPKFDGKEGSGGLNQTLAAMDALLVSKRPELTPAKAVAAGEAGEEDSGETGVAVVPTTMPSHEAARAALEAASAYFRRMEPSSPAFILVHQAASLIGRPLVEALAALMPTASSKAILRLGGTYEFDIDLTRMKSITEDGLKAPLPELPPAAPPLPPPAVAAPAPAAPAATEGAAPAEGEVAAPAVEPPPPPPPPPAAPPAPAGAPVFVARTRAEATGLMLGAEAFFRVVEPSSPIPLLLEKARGYLNRDFSSIMSELAPKS